MAPAPFRTLLACALLTGVDAYSTLAPRSAIVRSRLAVGRNPSLLQPHAALPAQAKVQLAGVSMMAEEAGLVKETSVRSAVKAVGWRFTAGVVTAITSYIFTGSLAMAASIVGWDLCSKSVTMYIGERLWNNVDWGKDEEAGADSEKRSLAKAIAWRIFAAFNTLVGSLILTKGKAGVAGKIAGSDSVVKTVLFYFYERAWANIGWGKVPVEAAPVEAASE